MKRNDDEKVRGFIAKIIVLSAAIILLATCAFMLLHEDKAGLQLMFGSMSGLLGIVLGYYFAKAK